MAISIVQRAHGTVSTTGGTVSFSVPTSANSVVVWMLTSSFRSISLLPTSDNAGNVVAPNSPRGTNNAQSLDNANTAGSVSVFGILKNPNDNSNYCLPMQTLTMTGPINATVAVWMFELAGMEKKMPPSLSLMDAQYFTQQNSFLSCNDLNNTAQNPMYSPAQLLYGGTQDHFSQSIVVSNPSREYFIVACVAPSPLSGGIPSISSVAAPFTLETIQSGLGCAWYISSSGYDPSTDKATFSNGGVAYYSSMWIALAGDVSAPANGTISIRKVTVPTGSIQPFTITPSWTTAISITDGQQQDFSLAAGTYSIVETPVTDWTTVVTVSSGDPPSAIGLISGQTVIVTFTNTFHGASGMMFQLLPEKLSDDRSPSATAINSTYCTYGFVNSTKATQNPLLGFHRKRFSEIQMNINGSGQETTTLFPNYILKNDLSFNPFAYTVPPIVLQTDPPDDIVRPVNSVGNRVYVMFSTNAVGARFSLSKTILVGIIDSYNTVNPNAG